MSNKTVRYIRRMRDREKAREFPDVIWLYFVCNYDYNFIMDWFSATAEPRANRASVRISRLIKSF